MRQIAVIPARGGSKRLPRKNILDFNGKPIIAYTIEAAVESRQFDRVVVSTEDAEIAEVSGKYGAELLRRPAEFATDTATVVEVCLHALEFETRQGRSYDILTCLYATAPLRNAEDVSNTVKLVQNRECDFAMAVTEYHYPPHQAMTENDSRFLEAMWPNLVDKRCQDMPKLLIDNGSTYVAMVSEFVKMKTFRGKRLKGFYMPRHRSVDIDVAEDLELAKYFAKRFLR
jgi:pseudaminic acid cytidylyltransferase